MARRRTRAYSVSWYLLGAEAALLVLGLLIALAGGAVFDSWSVIQVGLATAAVGLTLGLGHLLTLWRDWGHAGVPEELDRSEAEEWERMRSSRFRKYRRLLRENPPKPRDAS